MLPLPPSRAEDISTVTQHDRNIQPTFSPICDQWTTRQHENFYVFTYCFSYHSDDWVRTFCCVSSQKIGQGKIMPLLTKFEVLIKLWVGWFSFTRIMDNGRNPNRYVVLWHVCCLVSEAPYFCLWSRAWALQSDCLCSNFDSSL